MGTGMIYADKITREVFDGTKSYRAPDGTTYLPGFPPGEIPHIRPVTKTPRPGDDYVVTGWRVSDDFEQVWDAIPKDPVAIAKANALAEIDRLERSITDRMWREDAVGSTALMAFEPEDPRTGKTATQYIAYVNDAIAELRARL